MVLRIITIFFLLITNLRAQNSCTPIVSLPTIITKAGIYCLTNNLVNNANQNAITILTSGVTVDLQGYAIDSSNLDSNSQLYGVYSLDVQDITIKNGIIRGFMYGIYLSNSSGSDTNMGSLSGGYILENLVIKNSFFRGIRIEGANNVVRNCTVTSTGGTTVFNNSFAIGIESIGPGTIIEKNIVTETYSCGTGESVAISFSNNASGSSAHLNRITNKKKNSGCPSPVLPQGHSFGVWVGGNPILKTNVYLRNNNISNLDYGIAFSSPTTGWYGNNQISKVGCNYIISSDTVSTFDYRGVVSCAPGSLSLDELDFINNAMSHHPIR
ncbi:MULTISPECIES: hypothetical protein [unclassified Legionella]|uniref:hypothetical protein n=1 Tax=unclassified Legionella TaxID=2622702 RepID=UPI0010565CC3|nr:MULTISPECIES: hypothetical protein [unclassified Legionella]MDI9817756.1 hypothetical protein [Legionella sp. PL877]